MCRVSPGRLTIMLFEGLCLKLLDVLPPLWTLGEVSEIKKKITIPSSK